MKVRFLWIGFSIFALQVTALAQGESTASAHDGVHFTYAASEGCPTKDEFTALVKERGVVIPENESAPRALSVAMNPDPAHPEKWHGSLRIKDGTYLGSERTTDAATCAEVAHSLAIFTAIAMTPTADAQPSTPTTGAASSTTTAPESQSATTTQPAAAPYVQPKDTYTEPDFDNAPTLHRNRWSLSAKTIFLDRLAQPTVGFGVGLAGRYYFSERWGLKLDADFIRSDTAHEDPSYRVTNAGQVTPYYQPLDEIGGKGMLSAEFVLNRAVGTLTDGRHFDLRRIPADFFLEAGIGAVWTRPISLNDPTNRDFSYRPNLAFELGWGGRMFITRAFAINLGFALTGYNAREENAAVATTEADRKDSTTWYGPSSIQVDLTTHLAFEAFF